MLATFPHRYTKGRAPSNLTTAPSTTPPLLVRCMASRLLCGCETTQLCSMMAVSQRTDEWLTTPYRCLWQLSLSYRDQHNSYAINHHRTRHCRSSCAAGHPFTAALYQIYQPFFFFPFLLPPPFLFSFPSATSYLAHLGVIYRGVHAHVLLSVRWFAAGCCGDTAKVYQHLIHNQNN